MLTYKIIRKMIKDLVEINKTLYDETIIFKKPNKKIVELRDIPDKGEYLSRTWPAFKKMQEIKIECNKYKLKFDDVYTIATSFINEEKLSLDEHIQQNPIIKAMYLEHISNLN